MSQIRTLRRACAAGLFCSALALLGSCAPGPSEPSKDGQAKAAAGIDAATARKLIEVSGAKAEVEQILAEQRASFTKYVDYAVSSLPEPKPHFAERKAELVAAYRKEQAKYAEKLNWARIEPGVIKAFRGIDPNDAAAIEAFYRTPAGKAWAKASPALKIGIADAVTKVTKEIAPDTFEATEQLQKKVDAIKLDRLNHAGGKE